MCVCLIDSPLRCGLGGEVGAEATDAPGGRVGASLHGGRQATGFDPAPDGRRADAMQRCDDWKTDVCRVGKLIELRESGRNVGLRGLVDRGHVSLRDLRGSAPTPDATG